MKLYVETINAVINNKTKSKCKEKIKEKIFDIKKLNKIKLK